MSKEWERSDDLTELGQKVSGFAAPELSVMDHAEHYANQVAKAWEGTDLVEIVETKASLGQIHLLGRAKQEHERQLVHSVVFSVLKHCKDICESHIGKIFFLKKGKLVYGWVFSFSSDDLKQTTRAICEAIDEVVPRKEVLEAPLLGPGTPAGGIGTKGASPL